MTTATHCAPRTTAQPSLARQTTTISILIRDYLYYIEKIESLSPTTVTNRKYILGTFARWLDQQGIHLAHRVLIEDIDSYLIHRIETNHIKASSMNTEKQAIRLFFTYLQVYKRLALAFEPSLIRRSREIPPRIRILSLAEVSAVIAHCDNEQDKLMIAILFETGMRIAELASLCVKDIHENELNIRGKGSRDRVVFVTSELSQAIHQHLIRNHIAVGHIFKHQQRYRNLPTDYLSVFRIRERIQRQFKRCGYTMHPHELRHSFAIHWLRQGGDIRTLQILMGHTSIDTTQRYLQVTDRQTGVSYHRLITTSVITQVSDSISQPVQKSH